MSDPDGERVERDLAVGESARRRPAPSPTSSLRTRHRYSGHLDDRGMFLRATATYTDAHGSDQTASATTLQKCSGRFNFPPEFTGARFGLREFVADTKTSDNRYVDTGLSRVDHEVHLRVRHRGHQLQRTQQPLGSRHRHHLENSLTFCQYLWPATKATTRKTTTTSLQCQDRRGGRGLPGVHDRQQPEDGYFVDWSLDWPDQHRSRSAPRVHLDVSLGRMDFIPGRRLRRGRTPHPSVSAQYPGPQLGSPKTPMSIPLPLTATIFGLAYCTTRRQTASGG